jgi:hypothetical protein
VPININSVGEVYDGETFLGTVDAGRLITPTSGMTQLWREVNAIAQDKFRVYGIMRDGKPEVTIEVELTIGSAFHVQIGLVNEPFDAALRRWIDDRSEWAIALMEEHGYRAYTEMIKEGGQISGIGIHVVVTDASNASRAVKLLEDSIVRLRLNEYTF